MKVLAFILLLTGYVLGSEVYRLDLSLKKRKAVPEEFVEFSRIVKDLMEEEYEEVAPGIEVKKGCKVERGIASWYGGRFHGRKTASGEPYNLFKFTAASRTLPLGTYVMVRNEENGRVITVRINDRGPYVDGRIIDLSQAAAYKIGMMYRGIAMVQVIPLRCLSPRSLMRFYDEIIYDLANTY
ncbi:MAG: septal ring lytic transglycosylase RlpA family protein [Aquificota bacterium]|nr:septal ring lytic transglycosylase RlpA family protein [Aquificota bacterium]